MTTDFAIVGAGVIGCATAYELARAGGRCVVLDAREIGREASWASAGVISRPSPRRSAFQQLRRAGHAAFDAFAAELQEQASEDFEFRRTGTIEPILTEDEDNEARKSEERHRSFSLPFQRLSLEDALAREPSLSPEIRGAVFYENDYQVRNPRFVRALAEVAARHGARFLTHQRVTRLLCDGNRVTGVESVNETVHAGTVILAAGAWSAELAATAGVSLAVEPVRGQIVLLDGPPGLLRHIVHGSDVYCVPRDDGKVLVGATVEHVGFDRRVTAEGVHQLLSAALQTAPGLRPLSPLTCWAGLRPYAARPGGPFLGPVEGRDGLVVATGHYRGGILLAPITARLLRELLMDGVASMPLDPFRPDR
jgi:glycine oxidase